MKNLLDQFALSFRMENIIYFVIVIFLMPLNWMMESAKWKFLISKVHKISFWESIGMIFQGTSLGIITPGRVGEYGGRVLQLDKRYRAFGAFSTFISSLSQNTINIIGGILAIAWIDVKYAEILIKKEHLVYLMLASLILIVLLYFSLNRIWKECSNWSFFQKRLAKSSFDAFFPLWNLKEKIIVLAQSGLRYFVYVMQYYFMLWAFGIQVYDLDLILAIMLIFAIQTLLPLTPLLQFAIRGSIAITILGAFIGSEEVILAVSYGMWLINLLIPGLIGAISMYWLRGKRLT